MSSTVKDMTFVLLANYGGFIERLKALQPGHGFDYYAPKTGQCLRFPPSTSRSSETRLPCEE